MPRRWHASSQLKLQTSTTSIKPLNSSDLQEEAPVDSSVPSQLSKLWVGKTRIRFEHGCRGLCAFFYPSNTCIGAPKLTRKNMTLDKLQVKHKPRQAGPGLRGPRPEPGLRSSRGCLHQAAPHRPGRSSVPSASKSLMLARWLVTPYFGSGQAAQVIANGIRVQKDRVRIAFHALLQPNAASVALGSRLDSRVCILQQLNSS